MSAEPNVSEEKAPDRKEDQRPLLEAFRRLALASIGAIALAQDEAESLVDRLVERGEIARKDGEKFMKEVKEKRMKGTSKAEERFNQHIEEILRHTNVPSKADIEALGEKIASLSKKVDDLMKDKE